ncbi:MAG: xylose isomerase [Opitutus sp.]|nr:xylose isomerase [Opitutus sp.]MCS6248412.1 xylose isomerase [Opitutus sp.]MCS6275217.1 xylose isomerase [Opitutus sp.]MCS6275742.1 xylose isomerase [Opitutus sp.]MCS6300838.1 xylose isomerase [Opitutus sp.]
MSASKKNPPSSANPQLRPVATLWTLVEHPGPGRREWTLARKLRAMREAGFAAVCTVFDETLAATVRAEGLEPVALIFGRDPADYPALIASVVRSGATLANVQLMGHDLPAAESLRRWLALERRATDSGFELSLETHRDTITETPEKIFALAERYEQKTGRLLRLTWDFSHLAVVKHIDPATVAERYLKRTDLIAHATQFHFRPFNAHHVQIPVTRRGARTPEIVPYLDFATTVMQLWKTAPANRTRTCYACPELGPVLGGYGLSTFPSSWPDAIRLQRELEARWQAI